MKNKLKWQYKSKSAMGKSLDTKPLIKSSTSKLSAVYEAVCEFISHTH